ncbi:MAG: T9SS type A sorting domain-containing protein [Bacteroidota bacterium]
MKKVLCFTLFTMLLGNMVFGQELIVNGDFSLPDDGKKYSRIDSIPGWCTDAQTADENGREFDAGNNNAAAWAWDEGASIYQVIGEVPATVVNYNVSLDATCTYSWWADYTTDLYVIFSSFTGTDTTNRTAIDTITFTASCATADWATYVTKTGSYQFAAGNAHAGEHLVVEIKMYNSALFGYGSSWTYLHYDNVSVIKSFPEGIGNRESNGLKVYPVPAVSSVNISADRLIESAALYDINGRLIRQSVVNDMNTVMDISGLAKGMYFLTVRSEGGIVTTEKIVKE